MGPRSHPSLGALLPSPWVLAKPSFLRLWDKGPRSLEATCHSFPAIQQQASSRPMGQGSSGLAVFTLRPSILENIFTRSNCFGFVWAYPTPTSRTPLSSCTATLFPLNTNPLPSPWPLASYCLSLWICLFWVPHISGIILCVLLRVFLDHNVLKVSSTSSQVSEFASFYG